MTRSVVLVGLLANLAACSARCAPSTAARTIDVSPHGSPHPARNTMNLPFVPDSPALLLRATHVVRVRIDASAASPWRVDRPGFDARSVDVTVSLLSVLKGTLHSDERVSVRLRQERPSSMRVMDAPQGVWSGFALEPGAQGWVFASTPAEVLRDVLVEPGCIAVFDDSYGVDITLATRAGDDIASLLREATPHAASLHELFVDYLWARFGPRALHDPEVRTALFTFFLEPALSERARATSLLCADDLASHPEVTRDYLDHFTRVLFEAMTLPQTRALHDTIVAQTLPSVLPMQPGPRTPEGVFAAHGALRSRVREVLRAPHLAPHASPLLEWLR